MARRADHTREELKDMIFKAAWQVVGREGASGLTARRIASEIGYAPGTIYNIYNSMDDLCMHINARTLDNLHTVLNSAECNNPKKSVAQNMKSMAALYAEFARKHSAYWLMLFTYRFSEKSNPDWYEDKISMLFAPLENLLQPLFPPKQDRKRKIAARALWAAVHGMCFLQETGKIPAVGGRDTAVEEMSSYLIDNFIAGNDVA